MHRQTLGTNNKGEPLRFLLSVSLQFSDTNLGLESSDAHALDA